MEEDLLLFFSSSLQRLNCRVTMHSDKDLANLRPAVNWPTRTAALYLESFQYTARQVSFFSKKLLPLLFSLHVELHLTKSVLAYGLNIFFLLE